MIGYCSVCNKEINIWHKQQASRNMHFCSNECKKNYCNSLKIPNINCSNCGKIFYIKPSRIGKNKHNCCSQECSLAQRKLYTLNKNNPNYKYEKNENMFKVLDTKEKAYLLGWIASDGYIDKNGIIISIQEGDWAILKYLWNIVCPNNEVKYSFKEKANENSQNSYGINFSSIEMSADVCKLLEINSGKKSDVVYFDFNSYSKEIQIAFLRGYFDGDGCIKNPSDKCRYPICSIVSNSERMLKIIHENFGGNLYKQVIEWNGNACLDFLNLLYNDKSYGYLQRKYNLYLDWACWVPSFGGFNNSGKELSFKWNRCRKEAQAPFKVRASDSGWDLTLLEKVKEYGDVEFYSTGIKVTPEYGWYFDLVPRSSISKTDYMLANSIGIIDRTYVGEILVPLRKMKSDAKPLELPGRYVQIIPRPIIHMDFIEVEELEETERGEKGFGSSGEKVA